MKTLAERIAENAKNAKKFTTPGHVCVELSGPMYEALARLADEEETSIEEQVSEAISIMVCRWMYPELRGLDG